MKVKKNPIPSSTCPAQEFLVSDDCVSFSFSFSVSVSVSLSLFLSLSLCLPASDEQGFL
eukprot:COSAG03_NODE_7_length_25331_cov_113.442375_4_plen_59_part_00